MNNSSNNNFNNINIFGNNFGGNINNNNIGSSSLFTSSNSNVNNSSFLTKKRDIYQNNNTNIMNSFTHGLPAKKSTNNSSNNELGIDEDYHSITDNISKLSVLNSPISEKHSSIFLEKENEKAKKKEDKFKEIKKHSALSRMNFNIFEKNKS